MVRSKKLPRTREGLREAISGFIRGLSDPDVEVRRGDPGSLRIRIRCREGPPLLFRIRITQQEVHTQQEIDNDGNR